MKIIVIDNCANVVYPLSVDLFNDEFIVYHGTSSCFANSIESCGWGVNSKPYDMEDIAYVTTICESIYFHGSKAQFGALRSYTLGGSDETYRYSKRASFTQDFWVARNYAGLNGGETLHNLLGIVDELIEIICKSDLNGSHIAYLSENLDDYEKNNIPNKYAAFIENTKNLYNNSCIKEKLHFIKNKYDSILETSYPVIYVLKITPDLFSNWLSTNPLL